jgi:hypothetical protein
MKIGFTKDDLKRVAWTFVQAALGALVVGLSAQSKIPNNLDDGKQVALGLAFAAVAAGISAVKNGLLADGSTLK